MAHGVCISTVPTRSRLPIGFCPGHDCWASSWLTITTSWPLGLLQASVKRPPQRPNGRLGVTEGGCARSKERPLIVSYRRELSNRRIPHL